MLENRRNTDTGKIAVLTESDLDPCHKTSENMKQRIQRVAQTQRTICICHRSHLFHHKPNNRVKICKWQRILVGGIVLSKPPISN